jgi:hypothetical protein
VRWLASANAGEEPTAWWHPMVPLVESTWTFLDRARRRGLLAALRRPFWLRSSR